MRAAQLLLELAILARSPKFHREDAVFCTRIKTQGCFTLSIVTGSCVFFFTIAASRASFIFNTRTHSSKVTRLFVLCTFSSSDSDDSRPVSLCARKILSSSCRSFSSGSSALATALPNLRPQTRACSISTASLQVKRTAGTSLSPSKTCTNDVGLAL
jgi:hypothetical protein